MLQWMKNRLSFRGRASSREALLSIVFVILALMPASLVGDLRLFSPETRDVVRVESRTSLATGQVTEHIERRQVTSLQLFYLKPSFLSFGTVALVLWPLLAVCVRRLHDLNRPVWHGLTAIGFAFGLIPVLGLAAGLAYQYTPALAAVLVFLLSFPAFVISGLAVVVLLMWLFAEGDPDENCFGPPPQKATS